MVARIISFLIIALGAALWLIGSMVIAFPKQATSFDIPAVFGEFMGNILHPVSLLILLALDIVIGMLVLRDERIRDGLTAGRRLGITFLAILLYLMIALFIPDVNPELAAAHAATFGLVAYFAVGIVRGLSYAAPQTARPVGAGAVGAATPKP